MTIYIYRSVPVLAADNKKEEKVTKAEAATPKKSNTTFAMGQGSVYDYAKCSKWNETLTMKQETQNVENNAQLMHKITVFHLLLHYFYRLNYVKDIHHNVYNLLILFLMVIWLLEK